MRSIENLTSSAGEIRAVVEFDPAPELELPGGLVDGLPRLREAGLDLQVGARPGQRVEDMLQRLGMGAGRGEVRVDRFGAGPDPDGQRLGEGGARQSRSRPRPRWRSGEGDGSSGAALCLWCSDPHSSGASPQPSTVKCAAAARGRTKRACYELLAALSAAELSCSASSSTVSAGRPRDAGNVSLGLYWRVCGRQPDRCPDLA
jgi:hypothetical protein